jgi:hypothetical protein
MDETHYNHLFLKHRIPGLEDRYFPIELLDRCLNKHLPKISRTIIGNSQLGRPIRLLEMGSGPKKVLAWSQMHGNETTTTKAMLDLMAMVDGSRSTTFGRKFFKEFSLYFVPILNPDGAQRYTRQNAWGVDLNRDAIFRSQPESKVLAKLFDDLQPDICLNLHGQRSCYGLDTGLAAQVSFLAPAADYQRSVLPGREEAMRLIGRMVTGLESLIPGQTGCYDDAHNPNCVGDRFQSKGIPTILFEAGHSGTDYKRERTRYLIGYALAVLFDLMDLPEDKPDGLSVYRALPANLKTYVDILFSGLKIRGEKAQLAVNFREVLINGRVEFLPRIVDFGTDLGYRAHRIIRLEAEEVLINSHENVFVNEYLSTITAKNSGKVLFSSRI